MIGMNGGFFGNRAMSAKDKLELRAYALVQNDKPIAYESPKRKSELNIPRRCKHTQLREYDHTP